MVTGRVTITILTPSSGQPAPSRRYGRVAAQTTTFVLNNHGRAFPCARVTARSRFHDAEATTDLSHCPLGV